jgi:hypothetical protein
LGRQELHLRARHPRRAACLLPGVGWSLTRPAPVDCFLEGPAKNQNDENEKGTQRLSFGLTRALLRLGLEVGGWWPYLLALVDAALAGVIVALLALTMVIGVQAFDESAVHGGGVPVLQLDTLFDGIAKNPAAPEYWWAYALVLSSMIPSLVNLAIGGMAFARGIPWLARLLLQWIPEGKAVPEYKRQPAAIGLTVQMFAGAGLGIAAQAFLAWVLIFHLMPWIGLDLLDMARAVAALDLPMQLWQIFARIL